MDLEQKLLSKFKDLSASDKKRILSSDIDESRKSISVISEKRKSDGSEWTVDEVMALVESNDKVLYGALKHLYACQTDSEKEAGATRDHNGKGFNAYDAEFLTSICKQLLVKGSLSPKQKEVARKKLKKYRTQITALANSTS